MTQAFLGFLKVSLPYLETYTKENGIKNSDLNKLGVLYQISMNLVPTPQITRLLYKAETYALKLMIKKHMLSVNTYVYT